MKRCIFYTEFFSKLTIAWHIGRYCYSGLCHLCDLYRQLLCWTVRKRNMVDYWLSWANLHSRRDFPPTVYWWCKHFPDVRYVGCCWARSPYDDLKTQYVTCANRGVGSSIGLWELLSSSQHPLMQVRYTYMSLGNRLILHLAKSADWLWSYDKQLISVA